MATVCGLATQVEERLLARNLIVEDFFSREAPRLAHACHSMSERFLKGGRLLAFGRGPYATDAQHVSVEFVHPVIVGKRALPALDLSMLFRPWLETILHPEDIVMGFGPPQGDDEIRSALGFAHARNALTFALSGVEGSYAVEGFTPDPFIHQEIIEILYHTLWESVHVFLEHRELGHDVGDAGFLYPFLGQEKQQTRDLESEVATSIGMKVQDVTPEYIKGLQSAGYKVSINDIISAKVQDVTPEFIERAQKHGFKDLTLQKLIQLRQLGILDSKADI